MARTTYAHARGAQDADCRTARQVQRHPLSARTGREGSAGRLAGSVRRADDCQAHRSGCCWRRAAPARARWRMPRSSCCACARCCTSRPDAITTFSATKLQERVAERLGYAGQHAAPAGRALHGRLFPPCARHRPLAALGAARRRLHRSARTSVRSRRRHPLRRHARSGRAPGNLAGAVPGRHRWRLRGV